MLRLKFKIDAYGFLNIYVPYQARTCRELFVLN